MYDYHVHSDFSADCGMAMEDACQAAVKKGVKEIVFTDHVDYVYPGSSYKWEFDYDRYSQNIMRFRSLFQGNLSVLKGVEIVLHPGTKERNEQFVTDHEFDFVIGSVHIVEDLDLHFGDYFKGKQIAQALEGYYQTLHACVKNEPHFNVLGHLDLIKRYVHHAGAKVEEIKWRQYDDMLEDTLKILIETGRGIEINMSGYRYKLDGPLPDFPVLKLYKELGGEIVTIGSDAHTPHFIGKHFQKGYAMLEEAGFRYVTTFRERKPHFTPIGPDLFLHPTK
jgi:histidinol-phosphatase (PHP family)